MGRIRGAAAQGGFGEKGRLGLGKVSGPKHESRPNSPTRQLPTPSQAPNQTNSTALLVNDFPQIPNSQNASTECEKTKRITSNFPSLQTRYHRHGGRSFGGRYNSQPRRLFCLFCREDKGHTTRTCQVTIQKNKEIDEVEARQNQPKQVLHTALCYSPYIQEYVGNQTILTTYSFGCFGKSLSS
jgi:hypothetical protein